MEFFVSSLSLLALTSSIPIIDLSKPIQETQRDFYLAATKFGCFYLLNHDHGIDTELQQSLLLQSKKLFQLETSAKESMSSTHFHYGYTISTANKASHESWYFGIEHNKKVKNQWPTEFVLPDNKSMAIGFESTVKAYNQAMTLITFELNKVIALSLNLSNNFLNRPKYFGKHTLSVLQLIHHFPQKSNVTQDVFADGVHSDLGLLILLPSDDTKGLQVLDHHNQRWLNVDYIPNSLIIFIGDAVKRWSNDLFVTPQYRLITTQQEMDKYCALFYWRPSLTSKL